MKKLMSFLVAIVVLGITLIGCVRNDDEPVIPTRPISRLYVSYGDFQTDETQDPYPTTMVVDPADSAEMRLGISFHAAFLRGGGGVYFSPNLGVIFQSSLGDSTLQMLSVSANGVIGARARIMHEGLNNMRGIWYAQDSDSAWVYVANVATPSSVFVFNNAIQRNGTTRPHKRLELGSIRPWGIAMFDDNLLVTITGDDGGVALYENVSQADSVEIDYTPTATLRLAGANSIRGIAYSQTLDVLVLSDLTDNGKIYIFENASTILVGNNDRVVPTRTITGTNTGLIQPIDVTIDDREGAMLLYVANRAATGSNNHSILRFSLSDNGNVSPQTSLALPRTPAGIHIDARGVLNP